jgi:aspartate aminotransferase-like enzyme
MIRVNDPILLTPGPLTTSLETKQAMLRDWGSWDASFNAITATICRDLVDVINGAGTHVCVPLQGSGTFSVEAALANLVPRDGKVLVPQNGAYCQRIVKILKYLGRAHVALDLPEDQHPTGAMVDEALARDPAITHVAQVHCETGTGILNPLPEIAAAVARHGKGLIVDAMSSYGAIEIDVKKDPVDAVVAASAKCIAGPPGMGFVMARQAALGLRTFLPRAVQAPVIVTFHAPVDANYAFKPFYEKVKARGYILYPGKLTQVETFRVGCIGAIDSNEMRNVVSAVAEVLREMGIRQVSPAPARAIA